MAGLVLNVPYGSLAVPPAVGRRLALAPEALRREHWRLTDPPLLEIARRLVERGRDRPPRPLVVFGFSPLVVDPLGLLAAETGQEAPPGPAFLARDTEGAPLPDWSAADRELILERTARPYLRELETACLGELSREPLSALVTLRSFPSLPARHEIDRRRPRPPISVGASDGHTPEGLTILAGTIFRAFGLWPRRDWPHVPLAPPAALAAQGRLKILSLGIRRDLHLDELTGRPKGDREALIRVLRTFLDLLEQELDRVAKVRLSRAFPPKKASSVLKDPEARSGAPPSKGWMRAPRG